MLMVLLGVATTVRADNAEIARRQAAQRVTFSNDEIVAGFMVTAIGAELQIAGRGDRIRKYARPVRVFIDNRGAPDRTPAMERIVADIARHIRHLDLDVTRNRAEANVVVTLVRQRAFLRTLTQFYGRERARDIERRLEPQCLSGFRKDDLYRIQHSDVILVANIAEFDFLDCAYEELLQALGPINDTDKIPWTMFNDDVQMGFFDIYDQLILNILYDPRIQPGMTADEAKAIIPEILPSVRDWVARTNGLQRD